MILERSSAMTVLPDSSFQILFRVSRMAVAFQGVEFGPHLDKKSNARANLALVGNSNLSECTYCRGRHIMIFNK